MRITKLGHCAMVLEIDGVKILTDPGSFTTGAQEGVTGLDAILITHEHADHFHIESLHTVVRNNPEAAIITNGSVAKLIAEAGITNTVTVVGDGQSTTLKAVSIEGFGKDHAPIVETMGMVENTAYMIGNKFYFPGDNFHAPGRAVDVLALPVAGPWMKISEAVRFAQTIGARIAFGVHDGMLVPSFRAFPKMALNMFVPNTEYVTLADGESREF